PAARADCPRADQPPGPSLDHAPPHPGRDGPAGERRRVPQARAAHRRVGHLHGVAGRAEGAAGGMSEATAAGIAAPAGEPRPWGRAALWLIVLVPVFFATYGAANWLASRRAEVGSVVFGWEHSIPFVAWTIVPYWSIDLFYGLSLFVCATRAELDTHARRLLTAQLIAVACFILFPLRFTFVRPPVTGVAGFLFDTLAG